MVSRCKTFILHSSTDWAIKLKLIFNRPKMSSMFFTRSGDKYEIF